MPSTLRFRLVGVAPLLMRSGRLADPLDPLAKSLARLTHKRAKTDADHLEIAKIDWYGGLWTSSGRPCLPGEAVEAAFTQAARTKRLGRAAAAGFICRGNVPLEYEGPTDVDQLWADQRFHLRVPVQVAGRRTMRTRPLFPEWAAVVEVQFLPTLFDAAQVLEILRIGGDQIGVGDWRPKFGRFRVEPLEDTALRQGTAGSGKPSLGLARHGWEGGVRTPPAANHSMKGDMTWTSIQSCWATAAGARKAGLSYPTAPSARF